VANSDGDSCNECTVMSAMTHSTNTVFYQIAVQVGATTVAQTAHAAGIPDNLLPNPTGGISLGDKPVHVVDMAGTSGFALAGGRTAAAKTGTNQLGETRDNRDAWTVGYTPSLSAAVWVGTDKSDPIRTRTGKVVYGATLPGPIWQAFMNAALKNDDQDEFSPYEPMGTAAYANNGGGSSYGEPSTTATNNPDGDNGDDED